MTLSEAIARLDSHTRPTLARSLPAPFLTALFSKGRRGFLSCFFKDSLRTTFPVPEKLSTTLWGLKFRSPIFNASGMFKNGEAVSLSYEQGAGAYLAGTTTALPRKGNEKDGVYLPCVSYPTSKASSNWLGLPNESDAVVARNLKNTIARLPNNERSFPIGASLMGAPELNGEEKVEKLIEGMWCYEQAGVDFIELNESCPNTIEGPPQESDLEKRLHCIKDAFLEKRTRRVPVIVKFSPDTEISQVDALVKLLIELKFDGVNFGNTSTQYKEHRALIDSEEVPLFDYFTSTFGGGIGGIPLQKASLELVRAAAKAKANHSGEHEFHIIHTGGIHTAQDVKDSLAAGASLVQWFTGYFEKFGTDGHRVYSKLYDDLVSSQ